MDWINVVNVILRWLEDVGLFPQRLPLGSVQSPQTPLDLLVHVVQLDAVLHDAYTFVLQSFQKHVFSQDCHRTVFYDFTVLYC